MKYSISKHSQSCNLRKLLIISIIFLFILIIYLSRKPTMELTICHKQECLIEDLAINLNIDTKIYDVIATDAIIKYDQKKLLYIGLKDQEIFHKTLSRKLQKNKIEVSSFQIPPNSIKGSKNIATLYFKILKEGDTSLHLEYQPKETRDSNILSKWTSKDILKQTKDLNLSLKKP